MAQALAVVSTQGSAPSPVQQAPAQAAGAGSASRLNRPRARLVTAGINRKVDILCMKLPSSSLMG
jgi:hypothetical protein